MINSYVWYTNYKAGDIVKYGNNMYQALIDSRDRSPLYYPDYWQYIPPVGRVLFINKGTYYSSTTYSVLDVVTMNGKRYIAKKTTQGNAPAADGDNEYWQLIAESGNYKAILDNDGILN